MALQTEVRKGENNERQEARHIQLETKGRTQQLRKITRM